MFSLALTFFLVANPVGNAPAILALIKDFDFNKQRIILMREAFFALLIALFFQYFGEIFLTYLNIKDYVVTLSGGVLLLLVAFSMIFPAQPSGESGKSKLKREPFIVPIATPILSGPGLLAIIMLKSQIVSSALELTMAILIAWIGVFGVLLVAPYLQKLLGQRGLLALEQVMGMILALVSVEMFLKGSAMFVRTLGS